MRMGSAVSRGGTKWQPGQKNNGNEDGQGKGLEEEVSLKVHLEIE